MPLRSDGLKVCGGALRGVLELWFVGPKTRMCQCTDGVPCGGIEISLFVNHPVGDESVKEQKPTPGRQPLRNMSSSSRDSQSTGAKIPCAALPDSASHVHLSLLDGGSFMAETGKLHAGVKDERFRMYNWAFCISHKDRHVLWDLGMTGVCGSILFDLSIC